MSLRSMATALGALLLLMGIWGLFSPVVFGFLTTNELQGGIHVALGALGLWMAQKGRARQYLTGTGFVLLVVGILRMIPGMREEIIDTLNMNMAAAWLNVILGSVSVAMASARRGMDLPGHPTSQI